MADTTTNYGFKKPVGTEYYNVEDQNGNMDLIDAQIKATDNKASNIVVPVQSVNSKTGAVVLTASDVGAETPTGSQTKADAVQENLDSHKTDNMNSFSAINNKLNDYNSYASGIDANSIYTVIDYKRADGTLYMKSTSSGGISPSYTTVKWQFYDALGTTIILTKTWTIAYDANGKITSKVVA